MKKFRAAVYAMFSVMCFFLSYLIAFMTSIFDDVGAMSADEIFFHKKMSAIVLGGGIVMLVIAIYEYHRTK